VAGREAVPDASEGREDNCGAKESRIGDGLREAAASRVGYLEGEAVFAQLFPLFSPGLVEWAFRIISGGFRAGEFDGEDAVKVANLVALGLEPDIFYAGDLSGHGLDARQGFVFVVLGGGILPFVDDKVDDGLRLAEPILRRDAFGAPISGDYAAAEQHACGCQVLYGSSDLIHSTSSFHLVSVLDPFDGHNVSGAAHIESREATLATVAPLNKE
jgi:hypothetical protein